MAVEVVVVMTLFDLLLNGVLSSFSRGSFLVEYVWCVSSLISFLIFVLFFGFFH